MILLVDDLNFSRGLLGTAEDPPGSNHNFITEWYADRIGDPGFAYAPWCAMSRCYCYDMVGGDLTYAYCPYIERDAKAGTNGLVWLGSSVEVGAWVLFDFAGHGYATHVGQVEAIRDAGTFYTLEGNIGDAYRRELRDTKYVRGFVRVPYDGDPGPVPDPGPGNPPPASGRVELPLIHYGTRGRSVKFAQVLSGATPDGVFGKGTRAAIVKFQGDHGLGADGWVGPQTWTALLQAGINWITAVAGSPANLDIDGDFGPATTAAVQQLQRDHGLTVDGIAGYDTFGALTGQ